MAKGVRIECIQKCPFLQFGCELFSKPFAVTPGGDGGKQACSPYAGTDLPARPRLCGSPRGKHSGQENGQTDDSPFELKLAVFQFHRAAELGMQDQFLGGLKEITDQIVCAAGGCAMDLLDDFLSRLIKIIERNAQTSMKGFLCALFGKVDVVNVRDILGSDGLGKVPAQRAIGSSEIPNILKKIHLVQNDE